ncbi:hypothetical protein BFP75_04435 [Maribacter sp. 4G9]|nr:hypothetical protein BFP75_04435 [Maribacter sp. 4G9]
MLVIRMTRELKAFDSYTFCIQKKLPSLRREGCSATAEWGGSGFIDYTFSIGAIMSKMDIGQRNTRIHSKWFIPCETKHPSLKQILPSRYARRQNDKKNRDSQSKL